jgi:uncharacterized protein YuzE
MEKGTGMWTFDPTANAWYFALNERASPPYREQVFVEAIVDLDADGRVAGFEILAPPGALRPPKR